MRRALRRSDAECLAGALHKPAVAVSCPGGLQPRPLAHLQGSGRHRGSNGLGDGGFEVGQRSRHHRSDSALVRDDQPDARTASAGPAAAAARGRRWGRLVAQHTYQCPALGVRSSRQSPGPRRPADGDRTGVRPPAYNARSDASSGAAMSNVWPSAATKPPARRERCSTGARSCARSQCATRGPACGGLPGAVRSAPVRRGRR